jgi:hypothetical protein
MSDPHGREALAKAIHGSHDHPHLPGCLEMDRQSAAAILGTDYAFVPLALVEAARAAVMDHACYPPLWDALSAAPERTDTSTES